MGRRNDDSAHCDSTDNAESRSELIQKNVPIENVSNID